MKKTIYKHLGAIAYFIFIVLGYSFFLGMLVWSVISGNDRSKAPAIDASFIILCAFCILLMFFYMITKWSERYIITETYVEERVFVGKRIKRVNLSEIAEIGLSRAQDVHQLPKYIYFSKRILTDEERRNLLIAGADGSIFFFKHSKRFELALEKIASRTIMK